MRAGLRRAGSSGLSSRATGIAPGACSPTGCASAATGRSTGSCGPTGPPSAARSTGTSRAARASSLHDSLIAPRWAAGRCGFAFTGLPSEQGTAGRPQRHDQGKPAPAGLRTQHTLPSIPATRGRSTSGLHIWWARIAHQCANSVHAGLGRAGSSGLSSRAAGLAPGTCSPTGLGTAAVPAHTTRHSTSPRSPTGNRSTRARRAAGAGRSSAPAGRVTPGRDVGRRSTSLTGLPAETPGRPQESDQDQPAPAGLRTQHTLPSMAGLRGRSMPSLHIWWARIAQ